MRIDRLNKRDAREIRGIVERSALATAGGKCQQCGMADGTVAACRKTVGKIAPLQLSAEDYEVTCLACRRSKTSPFAAPKRHKPTTKRSKARTRDLKKPPQPRHPYPIQKLVQRAYSLQEQSAMTGELSLVGKISFEQYEMLIKLGVDGDKCKAWTKYKADQEIRRRSDK